MLKPGIFVDLTDDDVVQIAESAPHRPLSQQLSELNPGATTPNWHVRCHSARIEVIFMMGDNHHEVTLSVVRRSYEGRIVFGRETHKLDRDSAIITITSHVNWDGNWPVGISYTVIPEYARVITHNIAVMNDPSNRDYPPGYDPAKSSWDNALAILLLTLEMHEAANRGDNMTTSR